MSPAERYLRDRAESYARDAVKLNELGEQLPAVAYRTIADELRKLADMLRQNDGR